MTKLMKKTFVTLLAVCMAFACVMAINFINVKAETTVDNCSYGLLNGASVRIPLTSEDEIGFGLRYAVAIDAEEYDDLKALDADVKFGVLITTLENYNKAPLNEENVFSPNGAYEANASTTEKLKVAKVERAELAEYRGTEDLELIGKRYFNVSRYLK